MSFGERIKQYIDYKGLSIRSFEIQSTLKNGAISRVVKNNTSLNGDSIATLGKKWEDLNLNWLMKGAGEMLVHSSVIQEPDQKYLSHKIPDNEVKWYKDALRRADAQIELQKEMIETLKGIIDKQKKSAEKAGIEL
ncbi:MAG: hypothetical protein P1U56_13610 [Saprospiraceae bacterium]|nr:hypothetical protein [Saprospiraceae bacterium]